MCAAPADPSVLTPQRSKRRRTYALALALMVLGVGLLAAELMGWLGGQDGAGELRRAVFPIKHKAALVKLGVEYHYDRNAIVDSRVVDKQIVGLAAAGNLVVFDAESYSLQSEKVLHRRATCLGPVQDGRVLVGIANGCIVRATPTGLGLERVEDVPGVPRWIGRTAKGGLVVAYQVDLITGNLRLKDFGHSRTHDLGPARVLFLDRNDRLWMGGGDKINLLDLERGTRKAVERKGGWPGVLGFVELSDGQVWAFGGKQETGAIPSFIARVSPDKPVVLFPGAAKRDASAPSAPITHLLEDVDGARMIVVSHDGVAVADTRSLQGWKPLDAMGGSGRDAGAVSSVGAAHRHGAGVLLSLVRGGFLHVTPEYTRRHVLEGQYAVARPSEIVKLEKGVAFFGDSGPSFYAGGVWRALPDPIMPSSELLGLPRPGETERIWTAMLTIPLDGETSYVVAKAGVPRHYLGHIHGLRDTFLTARWDGKTLATLGREDLPIEPTDTFTTPDRHLWNVDDQGLWSFTGGHWKLVMRATGHGRGGAVHANAREASGARGLASYKSAIGEPLHFADSATPPFYGLPTAASSWVLVRLDKNDEGGVPLIDEVPVSADGRRLLLHDLSPVASKNDEFLLATDHGLCMFKVKWGTCELKHVDGIDGEVNIFLRDRAKRLWMGGPGLWVLRDLNRAVPVHPSVPMLADTRVAVLTEAPDGRLIVGLQDRGAIFLTVPDGWFDQPHELPAMLPPWEMAKAHEPSYLDASVVLRGCRDTAGNIAEASTHALLAELQSYGDATGGRTRLELEMSYDGRADVVLRASDTGKLLADVEPILGRHAGKAGFAVWKRQGPRGTPAIQVRFCPMP